MGIQLLPGCHTQAPPGRRLLSWPEVARATARAFRSHDS